MPDLWHVPVGGYDRFMVWLLTKQHRHRRVGRVIRRYLVHRGLDFAPGVEVGPGLMLPHGGIGIVVHGGARFGRNVTIYTNVTIGRADVWRPLPHKFGGFDIGDEVIIGAGAALMNQGPEPMVVAEGTVVGANAVLTRSTEPWEVWAGNPARRVSVREH